MPLFDLFSKRMKLQRGEMPDVYKYDDLPDALRAQIVHIWRDGIGVPENPHGIMWNKAAQVWCNIGNILRRELGVFQLSGRYAGPGMWEAEVVDYFLTQPNVEAALDVVQIVFMYLGTADQYDQRTGRSGSTLSPDAAIEELNARFKEHGVGYQLESGLIVRVDSHVLHAEAVRPAFMLLSDPAFAGANLEFLRAHDHHRHGRQEECLVDCLKAFESTMKVVCDQRKWNYDKQKDTAAKLIGIVFDNKLLPDHVQSEMTALRSVLESGVPTLRNRSAGHGAGATPRQVPGHVAAYALHLTAANIVFLVEAHKANPVR